MHNSIDIRMVGEHADILRTMADKYFSGNMSKTLTAALGMLDFLYNRERWIAIQKVGDERVELSKRILPEERDWLYGYGSWDE